MRSGAVAAVATAVLAATAIAAEIPLADRKSSYDVMGRETRAMQDDDTANAGMLWVLDGEALWRVTITNAGRVAPPENAARVPMIRLEAEADPLYWNGTPATTGERKRRSFKLWLSDDAAHVPLRLEMPVGIANVVVALTELDRR